MHAHGDRQRRHNRLGLRGGHGDVARGWGGRLEAPLAGFVTGFGQRFDTAREHVTRVEVRATDPSGRPVALDWDEKTGAPLGTPGATNMLRIAYVGPSGDADM